MAESEGCFVTNTNTPAFLGFIDVFIQIFLNRIQKPYTKTTTNSDVYCFFKTLCFFAGLKDLQQALVLGEAKHTAKKKLDNTMQNKGKKGKVNPEQEAHANRETALLWNSCGLTLNAMGCNQEAIQCYQEGMPCCV